MHIKRQAITNKLPIERKGSKYVVRTSSHKNDSVAILFALRDMLNIAKNLKEAKKLLNSNAIKLNWKTVKNYKQSIRLFNILQADKSYVLKISKTKRFILEEIKSSSKRLGKIINKRTISQGQIQITLHDGTVFLGDNNLKVGDSVYLDQSGKLVSVSPMEKGKEVFVISGKYTGHTGTISEKDGNVVKIKINEEEKVLPASCLITL